MAEKINTLKAVYQNRKATIRKKLKEFTLVPHSEYFYELVYCILTPQSSAENAYQVVKMLKRQNFKNKKINPEPFLRDKKNYIRFHRNKARYIIEAKEQFPVIIKHLIKDKPGYELRKWLVRNVKGLGMKEASHFLRNIGYRNLAILDRHILKNLVHYGMIKKIPSTLSFKLYLKIENRFQWFSNKIGIPLDELDLLFWSFETGKVLK